jgi:hypothetical protein
LVFRSTLKLRHKFDIFSYLALSVRKAELEKGPFSQKDYYPSLMELSPSSEAANCTATQELPNIL